MDTICEASNTLMVGQCDPPTLATVAPTWATHDIHHPKDSFDNDVQWRRIKKSSRVILEMGYSFVEDQNEYPRKRP
jgi:hypothetical protein